MLTFVGRPSGKVDNFKLFGAAGFRKQGHGSNDDIAAQGRRFCFQRSGFAHAAQVFKKIERLIIGYADLIDVGDRQGEPRTLKRGAVVAHACERGDPRRYAAGQFGFGAVKASAQEPEGFFAENGSDKKPVGFQRHTRLRERAHKIVRCMKRQHAGEKIEACPFQRQGFGVAREPRAIGREPRRRKIKMNNLFDAASRRQQSGQLSCALKNGQRERPVHALKTVDDVFHDAAVEKIEIRKVTRGACAAAGVESAVENLRRGGHQCHWFSLGPGDSLWPMKPQILNRLGTWGRETARKTLDLAMPPHCPVTREEIASAEALGAQAWAAAHFIEPPCCIRCGAPFSTNYGEAFECLLCLAEPPDFRQARAVLVYDDVSRRMIVNFKHGDQTELAAMFGAWMARTGSDVLTTSSILAPVPLHPSRLRARRFNQSALLARAIARVSGSQLSIDGLVRRRATPPQADLPIKARKRNVSGAFGVRDDKARERFRCAHVVLVDDVLTTGATLSAAARALKRAGAQEVDALVLARVVKGGVGAI